jgi:hypothetical protein
MIRAVSDYFSRLAAAFGAGWTRFWFTPSDPAAVSLIRLLTGLVVVYLHATLSFDLIALFGPDGLLPAGEIAPLEGANPSYLNLLRTPAELWAVHLIGLVVLLLFAAGFYTPLTAVLALVVFLSDVNRAPMITSTTEPVVAMVMLYLCLAPCGRRFSVDSLLARRGQRVALLPSGDGLSTMATISTRLIQIHLALLVAMMGFSMLAGEVWWTGSGVWWLVARPGTRLVDLSDLRQTPLIVEAWTHLIVLFELSFPVLIWVPLARPLMLAVAAVVWTSLALVTGDITFALMLGTAALSFVRPEIVTGILRGSRPAAARPA